MNKLFNYILLIIFTLVLCNVYANNPVVSELSLFLRSFDTYYANFKQVTKSDSGKIIQKSTGTMQIKRPGKFRWESLNPTHQILITDGKALWTYDIDLAQATKQSLSKHTSIDPAMLLSGSVKNLDQNFVLNSKRKNSSISFILIPKKSNLGFNKVVLTFENKKLKSMQVVNNLDQISKFSFSKIKINTPMPDSLFIFKPKPGVDVISQ